jgi:alpha-1,6-mannosyltransferase
MAASAILAGGLLIGLLRDLGKPTGRALIYLWSPLLLYETAHGAHVDALILPLLVGAWWARVHNRNGLVGVLLGGATAIKLFPAMLLPALWRPQDPRGRWQMPVAFGVTVALCYAPYLYTSGLGVIGFLPSYVGERFNLGLAGMLIPFFTRLGVDPNLGILVLTLGTLAVIALYMVVQPSRNGAQAVARSIWLMGAFTLLTQNLFAWYMLWMLPLLAIFVNPGIEFKRLRLPALDGWSGWWLFCGLIALSYSFFIAWRPVPLAIWSQFLPLYLLLIWDLGRRVYARIALGYQAQTSRGPAT